MNPVPLNPVPTATSHRLPRRPSISCLLTLVTVLSTSTVLTAHELWDESFRRSDFAGSLDIHARRLTAPNDLPPAWSLRPPLPIEVYQELELRFLGDLARRAVHAPKVIDALQAFLSQERTPEIEALANELLADQLHANGATVEAAEIWRQLGFLSSWWLVGPFDNERGSGFGAALPPEDRWDPGDEYAGKRGSVSWRRFGEFGPGGTLELGELLRPNEEALAYVACFVYTAEAMDLQLRVGSTGSYAIWVDGTEVARNDVERSLGFDQDIHAVRLSQGWHRLLAKSGQTKGDWKLRIRVTHSDGSSAWRGEEPADMGAQSFFAQSDAPDVPTPQPVVAMRLAEPTRQSLAALSESPDPRAPALLAYLLDSLGAHDRKQHPDLDVLSLVTGESQGRAIDFYVLATTYDEAITHSAEREQNPWRHALERALALDPQFHEVRRELASYTLERFANYARAEELIRPALADTPWPTERIDLIARLRGARHLAERETTLRTHESRLETEAWLAHRLQLVTERVTEGRLDTAAELVRQGLEFANGHPGLRKKALDILLQRGDVEGVREQILGLIELQPMQSGYWRFLSHFEATNGRWAEALAAIERALIIAPQEEKYHHARAEILLLSDKREAALAGFRASLELEPNQPRLREYLDHLDQSSSLRRDDSAEPLQERIATAVSTSYAGDDPVHELLHNQIVRVAVDGTTRRFVQYVARVGNDQGVRRLDHYSIPYAYGEQWVKVVTARAHGLDGSVEEATIRNRDPSVREGEYPTWASAWVDLPPLQPGSVVEIEYWLEDLRQSFFGDYFGDRIALAGLQPRDFVGYTLIVPKGKSLFFETRPGTSGLRVPVYTVDDDSEFTSHRWVVTDQPRIDPEPAMPPIHEVVPVIEISSFRDWNAFATWYHHLIRKQFDTSPAIRAKVAQLTEGCDSDLEKVRAIYEFVVSEVRYVAWEFGVHGFQPYRASTIFTRRFGDCKDKATLICVMLDELGIEAHPVLINGTRERSVEDFSLPLIDHFNHCIAFVPGLGPDGTFLDGTAEHHAMNELPLMDRGAKVLIVEPSRGRVTDVPWNHPTELALVERQRIVIDEDGGALLEIDARPTGELAVNLRAGLEIEGERKRRLERRFGNQFPGARVETVETSSLTNLNEPVRVEVRVQLPHYLDATREGIKLPPLTDYFGLGGAFADRATPRDRKFDLLLGNPLRSSLDVTVQLPPGHEIAHLPSPQKFESPFGSYSVQARVEGQSIRFQRDLEISAPRVPAEDYARFKRFVDDVEEARAQRILLRRAKEAVQ